MLSSFSPPFFFSLSWVSPRFWPFFFFALLGIPSAGCDGRPTVPSYLLSPLFAPYYIRPSWLPNEIQLCPTRGLDVITVGLVVVPPPSISPSNTPWIIWHKSGHNLLIFFFLLIWFLFFFCGWGVVYGFWRAGFHVQLVFYRKIKGTGKAFFFLPLFFSVGRRP